MHALARSASKLLEEVHGEEQTLELIEAFAKPPAKVMKKQDTPALLSESKCRESFHPNLSLVFERDSTILRRSSTAQAA